MAYTTGTGSTACDLLEAINTFLTTTITTNPWVLQHSTSSTLNGTSRLSECIWCGVGDGNDKIYVQMRIPNASGAITDAKKLCLDGLAGYDTLLNYYEQPGCIQQKLGADGSALVAQPVLVVDDNSLFTYWIFGDTRRMIVVIKLSTYYESMYLGFINPISSEKQYPYPLYVAGNGVATGSDWPGNKNGSFIFPSDGSGYLRRADGEWRAFDAYGNATVVPSQTSIGTVFPYNCGNTKLITNYTTNALSNDNYILFPVLLCTTSPYDINGALDGVYYVSGAKDISAEQILTQNSTNYIIFDTKAYRGTNTYFAVEMT